MKQRKFILQLALLLAVFVVLFFSPAADPKEKKTQDQAAKETTPPAIDPEAVATVKRMETFMQTLSAYSIHADTETDEVLLAGPKVQFDGTIDGTLQLPNRLRLTIARDDKDTQEFFYDGSTLTVWIKDRNVWATAPVAPTVGEMLKTVRAKYDLSFPLDDLLRGATRGELMDGVTAAIVIGTSLVGGVECDHLGFHKEGVDAQLWIEKSDRPLPRKIVITTLTEPSQPQHSEVLTWDLTPKIDEAMFQFTPPAGAEKIVFAEPSTQKTPTKEGTDD